MSEVVEEGRAYTLVILGENDEREIIRDAQVLSNHFTAGTNLRSAAIQFTLDHERDLDELETVIATRASAMVCATCGRHDLQCVCDPDA